MDRPEYFFGASALSFGQWRCTSLPHVTLPSSQMVNHIDNSLLLMQLLSSRQRWNTFFHCLPPLPKRPYAIYFSLHCCVDSIFPVHLIKPFGTPMRIFCPIDSLLPFMSGLLPRRTIRVRQFIRLFSLTSSLLLVSTLLLLHVSFLAASLFLESRSDSPPTWHRLSRSCPDAP